MASAIEQIQSAIEQNKIVLFMKGNRNFPQCGFSAATVQVFEALGVPFETLDVLADQELREAIKRYSNWPTIPQVYIDGKFVGGCDIVRELYENGELQELVKNAPRPERASIETAIRRQVPDSRSRGARSEENVMASEQELILQMLTNFKPPKSVAELRTTIDLFAPMLNANPPEVGAVHDGVDLRPGLRADLAVPKGAGPHPVVVYLHGGGWVAGTLPGNRKLAMQFAAAGYLTISVDYRLAPEHPFPAGLEDCIFGIKWAGENARRWNGDAGRARGRRRLGGRQSDRSRSAGAWRRALRGTPSRAPRCCSTACSTSRPLARTIRSARWRCWRGPI